MATNTTHVEAVSKGTESEALELIRAGVLLVFVWGVIMIPLTLAYVLVSGLLSVLGVR